MEIIAVAVVLGILAWIWQKQHQAAARRRGLAENGTRTEAIILRRFTQTKPKAGKRHYVEYRFHTQDGRSFSRNALVTAQDYLDYGAEDKITVIYDPNSPDISVTADYLIRKGYLDSTGDR
jgi:hypothetical protein